jgi:predicted hydrolase (HD superfamily)
LSSEKQESSGKNYHETRRIPEKREPRKATLLIPGGLHIARTTDNTLIKVVIWGAFFLPVGLRRFVVWKAMDMHGYDRAAAWVLLTEWTESESLRKHALGVEACVVAYGEAEAERLGFTGQDPARADLLNLYATTALLHDFDYERHPSLEEHPFVGVRELERLGWPEATRRAILGHATYSGVPRDTHLAKALFACDELSGFLTACALVKPSKAIADVEPASVRKKMKDKAFARGVNRQDVIQGAEELGVDLDAHIAFCLAAMQRRSAELGL